MEKIGDDKIVSLILKFRDAIRQHLKQGELQTPFGTRDLVDLADRYRVLNSLPEALYFCTFARLPNEEKKVYNETGIAVFGRDGDILKEMENNDEMDYMR